jgi:hypothetical protein
MKFIFGRSFFILEVVLLCGCAADHFTSGHGDIGQFIVQKAVASGATALSTNAVLAVGGHWRYFDDEHGVVIRMAPAQYPAVELFLIQTFGQPKVGPRDTPDGGRYGMYRLTSKGGVIQFGRDAEDGTHIEVIRPLTSKESADAVVRSLNDNQVQKALPESR